MKPHPLDEYPLHQAPLSLRYPATSDRNFYDRCYFNAHDRTGDVFLVTGLGLYPNLGVIDAYACVRVGDRQVAVRMSDALDDATDRRAPAAGPYHIEVVEPLQSIRVVCDADEHGVGFDLAWEGSFAAVEEAHHVMRAGPRAIIDACRFAQVGTWSGELRVEGHTWAVSPDSWVGSRDRSWGIRPVGEAEPGGRAAAEGLDGFWWLYVPLRFDDFGVVLIAQERADGYRTLNDAVRVWGDGRVEQLGWPEVSIRYRSGGRHPLGATVLMKGLELEIETLGDVALHVGAGYGGDPDWSHGQWKGRGWIEGASYDLTDSSIASRIPFGVIDHVARATTGDGAVGWGLFEHGTMGRHDPSGFADWGSIAP